MECYLIRIVVLQLGAGLLCFWCDPFMPLAPADINQILARLCVSATGICQHDLAFGSLCNQGPDAWHLPLFFI